MKKNALELVFILDRSGSMNHLTDDTIGGFNSILDEHRETEEDVVVTTVLFNSRVFYLHDRIPLAEVPHMTRSEYRANGNTALYDAVGSTIDHIAAVHHYIRPEDVPEKTLFIITTDGLENASRDYSRANVKRKIEQQRIEASWEFLFLAANIDTVDAAESIGIHRSRTSSFQADVYGVKALYKRLNRTVDLAARYSLEEVDWEKALSDEE